MKLSKFTVILAVLLMAILAIGAVSAESIDDSVGEIVSADTDDVSADVVVDDNVGAVALGDGDDGEDPEPDDPTIGPEEPEESENTYKISDDTYSTYFNDNGTPTEALSADGGYEIQIGLLQNKNITILSGKNINISYYWIEEYDEVEDEWTEYGGDLFNSTLTIGANVESVFINGLTFHNTNQNAININDGCKDINISENVMFLDSEESTSGVTGINLDGAVSGVFISDNSIFMACEGVYNYGINLMAYAASTNPSDITISDNRIEMGTEGAATMLEGMYLSNPDNLLVEDNIVVVNTVNDVYAYGIQVADDAQYAYISVTGYAGNITSPRNILIRGNEFYISSEFVTYAVSVLCYGTGGVDEEWLEYDMIMPTYNAFDTNITISDNDIVAKSTRAVMGIAGQTYNMTVNNNNLIVLGGSAEGIKSDDALGNGTYALEVQYTDIDAESGYYITVKDNTVVSNVTVEHLNENDFSGGDYSSYVIFENNTLPSEFVINDETYSAYFNEDGTSTGILPAEGGYTLVIQSIEGKDIKITSGSNIYITGEKFYDDADELFYEGYISDGTIIIGDGSGETSFITIEGLTFNNVNKDAINFVESSTNITVINNYINIDTDASENDDEYFTVNGIKFSGYVEDVEVSGNSICIEGDAVYQNGLAFSIYVGWSEGSANPTNIHVADNEIEIIGNTATGSSQGIYLDTVIGALVENNNVTVNANNDCFAYGIQFADSSYWILYYSDADESDITSGYNVTIKNNKVDLSGNYMCYGITALSGGYELYDGDILTGEFPLDILICENEVIANSARGVMGIAGQVYNMTVINNNLTVVGGSAEGITSGDALRAGTYALGVQYNNPSGGYFVVVKDNNVLTNVTAEYLNSDTYRPYVIFENNTAPQVYVINDESYENYFNEDGTAKDILSEMGGYVLMIDEITNKNIVIASGSDINITGLEDSGKIYNGTIVIGDGYGSAGSIIISGLSFENTNKNAIEILDLGNYISIVDNEIDVYGDSETAENLYTIYGITSNGFITGLNIDNNKFYVYGDIPYTYAISVSSYAAYANPEDITISNNYIYMDVYGETGMAEAIYLDNPINSVVEDNNLTIFTYNDVFAYGIQVADSIPSAIQWASYVGDETSPYNVTIKGNKLSIESEYMIYAISALSSGTFIDELGRSFSNAFELNITISDNEVDAYSEKGVMGIVGQIYNMTVNDNTLYIYGGSTEGVVSGDSLGVGNYALGVLYNDDSATDYYVIFKDNTVFTNVTGEYLDNESYSEFVIFDNKIVPMKDGSILINEETYDIFFNEDGTLKDDAPLESYDYVMLGNLTGKNMIFDLPLYITADEDCKLVNSTISLVEGANSFIIDGLTFEFTGDNETGSIGLIYAKDVSDVSIRNNKFIVPEFVDKAGSKYGSSIYAIEIESGANGCSEIEITGNEIEINGSARYLYGIDVFQTWGSENKNSNVTISDNIVTINGGSRMAEAIYASAVDDLTISDNTLTAISEGSAYGMGTDSLSNAVISGNTINANGTGSNMVYGIANTYSNDVAIENNTITANGRGVVGIGVKGDTGITIDGNTIDVTGRDYQNANTSDSIGKANAAIFNSDESEVTIGENTIIENFPALVVFIDDSNYDTYFDENGNIIDGALSENDAVQFGDLTGKKLVINIPLTITAAEDTKLVNSTISLVEGADGTVIDGLTFEFTGDNETGSIGLIYAKEVSDIAITNNKFFVPEFVDKAGSKYGSTIYAIEFESGATGCHNVEITDNEIDINGSCRYLYGIDVFQTWQAESKNTNFTVANNTLALNGGSRMAEAIYASAVEDIVIADNTISSTSQGSAYGIATDSLTNGVISGNTIVDNATVNNMAYAIANTHSNNVSIENNNIIAEGQGAIGVGVMDGTEISIDGNTINITGRDFTVANTSDSIGKANAAIFNSDDSDVTVGENTIIENGPKFIDDSNYDTYFYENGTIKDTSSITEGDILFIGELTNKKMIIDTPVEIKGLEGNKLVNTTINLVAGADGTIIDGLNMEFTGDETTGSVGLIYAKDVSDIAITNNKILVPNFVDKTGAQWGSSIYAIEIESGSDGCNNVTITDNNIEITGTARYLYGIDVFKTWGEDNERNSDINISNNNVTINGGSRMAEAVYVSESDDVTVSNNIVNSISDGAAYGISTDQLANAEFTDNTIVASSNNNMAYGITATTLGSNTVISGNDIDATGVGAVGVGISGQDTVTVENNNIDIVGGDFTTITTVDNLGTANAAILVKDESGNQNINIGENTLTENGKATDLIKTGNGGKDLQAILDAAEAGSTVDLTDQYFNNVADVNITKDLTITGATIVGKEGADIFVVDPAIDEFTLSDSTIRVNNANTVVKVIAENATSPTAIDVPAVTVKDNTIELANDDVVPESVTVMELESERGILAPNNDLTVSGNTLPAGVDPFEFTITSISEGGNTNIPAGGNIGEKLATVIEYEDMNTTAIDSSIEPGTGKYFEITLRDSNGVALANKPVQFGFNGKIYNKTTDENGIAKLQINLQRSDIYTFAVSFQGDDAYNGSFAVAKITVKKQTPTLTVPNKSYKASAKTKTLTATFKSASVKVVANKKVTFTVNGKTYTATTNDKGVASVNVSLSTKKTYSFTAKFAGDNTYAAITKTAKLTIN